VGAGEIIGFLLPMTETNDRWLDRFYAGDRDLLAEVYEEQFELVFQAVGRVVGDVDQETVVHELFCRLLASETMRRGFRGGTLAAWLTTLAKHQAIDFVRKYRREGSLEGVGDQVAAPSDDGAEAKRLVDGFRTEALPQKWAAVFEARFLRQLSQREAAASLGISRTTLVYQELRVRRLMEKYFLRRRVP
jgi:RNA polymerase sigma-70 factor (ECF subfamily)